jgi:hypothetical protein
MRIILLSAFLIICIYSNIYAFIEPPDLIFPSADSVGIRRDSISFNWKPPANVDGVQFQLYDSSSFKPLRKDTTFNKTDTIFVFYGLNFATKYYWQMRSFYNSDTSVWSGRTFTTMLQKPDSVTITPIKDSLFVTSLRPTVSWATVHQANNYTISLQRANNLYFSSDSNYYVFPDNVLNPGDICTLYISAKNTVTQNFSDSTFFLFTVLSKPGAFSLILPDTNATKLDKNPQLTWEKSTEADSYKVIYNDVYSTISDTIFTFQNPFSPGDSVNWNVTASNGVSDTSASNGPRIFYIKNDTPEISIVPNYGGGTPITSLKPEIHWSAGQNVNAYRLYVLKSGFLLSGFPINVSDTKFKIDDLVYDSEYVVKVIALRNNLVNSDTASFTFKTKYKLLKPIDIGNKVINLSVTPQDSILKIKIKNLSDSSIVINNIQLLHNKFGLLTNSLNIGERDTGIVKISLTENNNIGQVKDTLILIVNNMPETEPYEIEAIPLDITIFKAAALVEKTTLNYGEINYNESSRQKLKITNTGNYQLSILSYSLSDSTSYKVISTPPNNIIGVNDSAFFEIEFRPTKPYQNSAQLKIKTNSIPQKDYLINLFGSGKGGSVLNNQTSASLLSLSNNIFNPLTSDSIFTITLHNSGNKEIQVENVSFLKNHFRASSENFSIPQNSSQTLRIRFSPQIISDSLTITDSLIIKIKESFQNVIGCGLKGKVDREALVNFLKSNITLNNNSILSNFLLTQNHNIIIEYENDLLKKNLYLESKFYFMKGGDKDWIAASKSDSTYIILNNNVTEKGIVLKYILYSKQGTQIRDSIIVFDNISPKVTISNYDLIILTPKSIPVSEGEINKTKWFTFGIPFGGEFNDSLFSSFGIKGDGMDWVSYEYKNKGYVIPSSYSSHKGYFIAQTKLDTFKVEFGGNGYSSRSLTDTILFLGKDSDWKTFTNPFTFPVQVNKPVYSFNTHAKQFDSLTTLIETGKGYFAPERIDTLIMYPYGTQNRINKPFYNSEWYVNIKVIDEQVETSRKVSVNINSFSKEEIKKENSGHSHSYKTAPTFSKGLNIRLHREDEIIDYLYDEVNSKDGFIWDAIIIDEEKNNCVKYIVESIGILPDEWSFVTTDLQTFTLAIEDTLEFNVLKQIPYKFKVAIGNSEFIKRAINNFNELVPSEYNLSQNFPNPFNPTTKIVYTVPSEERIKITIYNLLGEEVKMLISEDHTVGKYTIEWNGHDNSNKKVASGIYFYRLDSPSYSNTKKMVLIK